MTETTSPTPCKCGMTPYITGNFEMGYKVFCPNTGCDLDAYATGNTEAEAIAAWNRRATPPAMSSPAPAAEGWKLVPVEPTPEMVDAACTWNSERGNYSRAYAAMIDAAPPAPVAAPHAMQEEALTTCVTCQGFGSRAHPDDPHPLPCVDCNGTGAVSATPPGEGSEALGIIAQYAEEMAAGSDRDKRRAEDGTKIGMAHAAIYHGMKVAAESIADEARRRAAALAAARTKEG